MRITTKNTQKLILTPTRSTVSLRPILGQGAQGQPGPGSAAWAAGQAVTVGVVRQVTDGTYIRSTANRTTRSTFDATEQSFWTPIVAYSGTLENTATKAVVEQKVAADAGNSGTVIGGALSATFGDFADDQLVTGAPRVAKRASSALHSPGYTQTTLVSASDPAALSKWHANPSPAIWKGYGLLTYDNNQSGGTTELAAGQKIALRRASLASDLTAAASWVYQGQPFSDSALCTNPRTGDGHIQSNLVTAGDTHPLLCMWNVSGSSGFVSKLLTTTGKWTNYRLEWNGTTPVLNTNVQAGDPPASGCSLTLSLDGITDWGIFFPSNPVLLKDGTIAAPVAFHSIVASSDAVANDSTFQRQAKFVAVLYFDADGNPLYLSERVPLTSDVPGYAPWEPYLLEALDGALRMFIRNLKTSGATDAGVLAVSESRDRRSWSPARATEVLTASERANAVQVDADRWVAAMMDFPAGLPGNQFQGRFNPTLFVSRTGQDDFIPAMPFGDTNTNAIYPQVITHDGVAYVAWYRQRNNLNDLMLSAVTLPPGSTPRVYPRRYHEISGKGPAVVGSKLSFNAIERATASTAPLTHASHGWAASLTPRSTQGIIGDCRSSTSGSVLHVIGFSLNSLSVLHGLALTPGQPFFIAAQVDAPNRQISVWASANGGALTQVSAYARAIALTANPGDGETIVINGVTYTFKSTPTTSTHVQIYSTAVDTAGALAAVLAKNSMTAGTYGPGELICARLDGADFTVTPGASVTVNATIPDTLMSASQTPRIGQRRASTSLMPLDADIDFVRAWDATVHSLANVKAVYNDHAAIYGFSTLSGASAPATPTITLDASSTTSTWPDLTDNPQGKVTIAGDVATVNGEASLTVELPYPGNELPITAQLGATPSGTDKYVIASFDTAAHLKRLYIDGSAPTSLKLDGTVVMTIPDPTREFSVKVAITPDSIIVGQTVQRRTAPGAPRLALGQFVAEGKLVFAKTTRFNIAKLALAEYRDRPLDPSLVTVAATPTTTNTSPAVSVRRATEAVERISIRDDGSIAFGDGTTAADTFLSRVSSRVMLLLGALKAQVATATGDAFVALVDGDASPRFRVRGDGQIELGPGTATRDTKLWRSGADQWYTEDSFEVGAMLSAAGAMKLHRRAVSSSTSVAATDIYIGVTSTSSARTLTLPDSADATTANRPQVGQVLLIKDESNAAGTNNITIQAGGSDTFLDGGTTRIIKTNRGHWKGIWTGSGWATIGGTTELAAQWRVLRSGYQRLDAQGTGTLSMFENNTTAFGTSASSKAFGALDPADFGGAGKLKIRMTILTNDTAPTSTFTGSLVPISGPPSGAAATVAASAGADVSGSTAAVAAPAANSATTVESAEFACPAAGLFALKLLVSSAAMVASSAATVRVELLGRVA